MCEEELNVFYELINGFEIVGTLTDDGKKLIKEGVQHLQKENQRLKEKYNIRSEAYNKVLLENADLKEKIILLKASEPMLELEKYYGERDKYKEVIEEVNKLLSDEFIEVLDKETIIQILDKVGETNE